jgi:hypothetical protein
LRDQEQRSFDALPALGVAESSCRISFSELRVLR